MQKYCKLIFIYSAALTHPLIAYDQPFINLGFSNMLDGGPVRPTYGWYIYQIEQYYGAHKFLNAQGAPIDCVPSPKTTVWDAVTSITYQTESSPILGAQTGLSVGIPYVFSSVISKNTLDLLDSGKGFGDLLVGTFLQWPPLMYKNRGLLVTRLELDVSFPTGKNKAYAIFNPGNGLFFINPYWAGTFYFTKKCAASWRLQYVWSSINKNTTIQPGQAIFMNYDLEYEIIPHFWVGAVGYFLQQITDSKVAGVLTPGRKDILLPLARAPFTNVKKSYTALPIFILKWPQKTELKALALLLVLFITFKLLLQATFFHKHQ